MNGFNKIPGTNIGYLRREFLGRHDFLLKDLIHLNCAAIEFDENGTLSGNIGWKHLLTASDAPQRQIIEDYCRAIERLLK